MRINWKAWMYSLAWFKLHFCHRFSGNSWGRKIFQAQIYNWFCFNIVTIIVGWKIFPVCVIVNKFDRWTSMRGWPGLNKLYLSIFFGHPTFAVLFGIILKPGNFRRAKKVGHWRVLSRYSSIGRICLILRTVFMIFFKHNNFNKIK